MTTISASSVISALFIYAPQFYTTDPTQLAYLNSLYTLITCQVNVQFLSCCGPSVFAFLMAHYLTLANNPNIGVLLNIHEGDLSIAYNVESNMQALELTPYGRSYLDLVNRTTVGATVTNLPVQLGGIIQNMPVTAGCQGWSGQWGSGGCGCC
jgi:hypothetical protein